MVKMATLRTQDWLKPEFQFHIYKAWHDRYPRHRHDFFEFFYVCSGKIGHTFDGRGCVLRKGDIVFINPSHEHGFDTGIGLGGDVISCLFSPSLLDSQRELLRDANGLADLLYLRPFFTDKHAIMHLSGRTGLKIAIALEEMLDEYSFKLDGYQLAIRTKLIDLLISLARHYDKALSQKSTQVSKGYSSTGRRLVDALEYIDAHFAEAIYLDNVAADKVGVTKEYFCHIFKQLTNMTYTEYLTKLRINHAKQLLAATSDKIINISIASGFNDLRHFNRTFKSATGLAPKTYRQQTQQEGGFSQIIQ